MTIGLVGRKVGMMRIFTDEGDAQPVTVLDVSDNRITQIKTADKDGYAAVQVAFGKRRASRVKKPLAGHLAKAAVEAGHTLKEFRAEAKDLTPPAWAAPVSAACFFCSSFSASASFWLVTRPEAVSANALLTACSYWAMDWP